MKNSQKENHITVLLCGDIMKNQLFDSFVEANSVKKQPKYKTSDKKRCLSYNCEIKHQNKYSFKNINNTKIQPVKNITKSSASETAHSKCSTYF